MGSVVIGYCDNTFPVWVNRLGGYAKSRLSITIIVIVVLICKSMSDWKGGMASGGLKNTNGRGSGRFESSRIPLEGDAYFNPPLNSSSKDAFGLILAVGNLKPIWQLESLFCYTGTWQDERQDKTSGGNSDSQEVILTIATGLLSIDPLLTLQNPRHSRSFVTNGRCTPY